MSIDEWRMVDVAALVDFNPQISQIILNVRWRLRNLSG